MRAVLLFLAIAVSMPATAQAPDAAYRAMFAPPMTNAPETLRTGWSLQYRGIVPNAAFAFAVAPNGRSVWEMRGGQASEAAAREAALTACNRAAQAIGATCQVFATNGDAAGRPPLAAATQAFGPLTASAFHYRHGPQRARGVVVWSHGTASSRGIGRADARGTPVQGWVSLLNDAGWDVVRFDRAPDRDEAEAATAQLLGALPLLRQAGYARIVLAGQSRGGWHSLLAAQRAPEQVFAVVAVAPAAHGADPRFQGAALDDWRRLTGGLPAAGPRLASVLFRDDAFDASPPARIERWEARAATRQAPSLLIAPASGPADHSGGFPAAFTQSWGPCLLRFVNDATPPTGTHRDRC